MEALFDAALRGLKLLGEEDATRVFTTVGPGQEYFLIDEQYYFERPDLVATGRTLFGAKPPKGHEVAPIFENSNVGVDHQMLTMQILSNVARRYGLVCLLHEKPFARRGGSADYVREARTASCSRARTRRGWRVRCSGSRPGAAERRAGHGA